MLGLASYNNANINIGYGDIYKLKLPENFQVEWEIQQPSSLLCQPRKHFQDEKRTKYKKKQN